MRMYYRSRTGTCCCIGAGQTLYHDTVTVTTWASPTLSPPMIVLTTHEHQLVALFCVKWHHGRNLEIITSYHKSDSVNRCVFPWEHSRQIPSRFDLKRRSPTIFEELAPTTRRTRTTTQLYSSLLKRHQTTRWVAIWDQFQLPARKWLPMTG